MIKKYLNIICLEAKLEFKEMFRYKISLVSDFIIFTLMYVTIYFMNIESGFMSYYLVDEKEGHILVLVGFIFWQFSSMAIGCTSSSIRGDALRGLLETKMQSVFPLSILIASQMVVDVIVDSIAFIGIFCFSCVTLGTSIKGLVIILCTIVVAIPSIFGAYGMGMILGGLTLIEKNIGQFVYLVQLILLFLSNALSPTRGAYSYLLPFTGGVEIIRNIYLGESVRAEVVCGYVLVNIVWIIIGVLVFNCIMKVVRKKGVFSGF